MFCVYFSEEKDLLLLGSIKNEFQKGKYLGHPVYVKFQIFSNSSNTTVVTYPCSVQFFLPRKERIYSFIQETFCRKSWSHSMETAGWYDVFENNIRPPPHYILELPDVHIWKYSYN